MDDAILKLELAQLREMLAPTGVPWALSAGAAVYLYTGNRPPADLDVLVRPRDLGAIAAALGVEGETEQTSWGENSKIVLGRVEVSGLLVVRLAGERYEYEMDDEMARRIRPLDFQGTEVPVLAPEDLIALKAVLQRGVDQGKHDLEDIQALAAAVDLDLSYLLARLRTMGAEERASPILEELREKGNE